MLDLHKHLQDDKDSMFQTSLGAPPRMKKKPHVLTATLRPESGAVEEEGVTQGQTGGG